MWKRLLLSLLSYRRAEAIKTGFAVVLYYSGIAYLLGRWRGRGATILLYHSVGGEGVFSDNVVALGRFAEQMAWLSRRRRIVSMTTLLERLSAGAPIPSDWVVITFDDGYRDNATRAVPVLRRHEATASFYVTWEVLEDGRPFFYDEIESLLLACADRSIEVPVAGRIRRYSLATPAARRECALRLVLSIREAPDAERRRFVEDLRRRLTLPLPEPEPTTRGLYLDAADLREMVDAGMEIGSHTLTHPDLAGLDGETLRRELQQSKKRIEGLAGRPVHGLAYPYGKASHFDDRVEAEVARAGYAYALTTVTGCVRPGTDPFALPRVGVRDTSLARLKVSLLGVHL